MPDSDLITKFQSRLLELGCPTPKLKRAVGELADHYEDLKVAGQQEGLSEGDARIQAEKSIGEAKSLAERTVAGMRASSWWGRHCIIGFGVLPFLSFIPLLLLCIAVVGSLFELIEWSVGHSLEGWVGKEMEQVVKHPVLLWSLRAVLNGSVMGILAVAFCFLAYRSMAGSKWAVISCLACAAQGLFFRVWLTQHNLILGYSWKPNLICAFCPMFVAVVAILSQRNRRVRLSGSLLLPVLMGICVSGCATRGEKAPVQRGWIGGQYKLACKANFRRAVFASPVVSTCLPKELEKRPKAAILITKVPTNSPAAIAGLREHDLILEANHRPVTRLKEFQNIVDRSTTGNVLPLKLYRDGQTVELPVRVGQETFRKGGNFSIVFPTVVHGWDFWYRSGLSLVFVGYEPNPGLRRQLEDSHEVYNEDWKAFAGIFEFSLGKHILKQEN